MHPDRPKVYISADMEGVAGVVTAEQLGPAGFEYERFREFMTQEVVAAIAGAREAGAGEIVVSDSHGNAQNILIEKLPPDVTLIRSFPRPLVMMEGIDDSFDAAIFVGYHTAATNVRGVRAHTYSSARLTGVEINGRPVSEAAMNAYIAGHFGVPVVAVTGDDAAVDEARRAIGPIEMCAVKRAIGLHSAESLTPAAAAKRIRDSVRRGVERRGEIEPLRVSAPVRLHMFFKHYRPVELLAYLPIVSRPSSHSILYEADDIVAAIRFLTFAIMYSADLEP